MCLEKESPHYQRETKNRLVSEENVNRARLTDIKCQQCSAYGEKIYKGQ